MRIRFLVLGCLAIGACGSSDADELEALRQEVATLSSQLASSQTGPESTSAPPSTFTTSTTTTTLPPPKVDEECRFNGLSLDDNSASRKNWEIADRKQSGNYPLVWLESPERADLRLYKTLDPELADLEISIWNWRNSTDRPEPSCGLIELWEPGMREIDTSWAYSDYAPLSCFMVESRYCDSMREISNAVLDAKPDLTFDYTIAFVLEEDTADLVVIVQDLR